MAPEHYFSAQPASAEERRPLRVHLAGRELELETASGIFSPDHVDDGTQLLLDEVPAPAATGHLLDIGCGWGPIALTLALESPDATVWAVDVNDRALDVLRRNAERLGLSNLNAVRPEQVPADIRFETIWSNPPIRIGKAELHGLLEHWLPRLAPAAQAEAWLVVGKHLGADSLQRWLAERFAGHPVERAAVGKGFRLLRVGSRAAD